MANRAPDTLPPAATWAVRAACREDDPDDYFDERTSLQDLSCGQCPVAAQCLKEAMAAEGTVAESMRFGVFGGLTSKQRAALVTKRVQPSVSEAKPPVRVSAHGPAPVEPCGTRAAYRRHHRHKEQPCAPCRAAESKARSKRQPHQGAAA